MKRVKIFRENLKYAKFENMHEKKYMEVSDNFNVTGKDRS